MESLGSRSFKFQYFNPNSDIHISLFQFDTPTKFLIGLQLYHCYFINIFVIKNSCGFAITVIITHSFHNYMLTYVHTIRFSGLCSLAAINRCMNGATCKDVCNNYTCTCAPGFTGWNCETGEAFVTSQKFDWLIKVNKSRSTVHLLNCFQHHLFPSFPLFIFFSCIVV